MKRRTIDQNRDKPVANPDHPASHTEPALARVGSNKLPPPKASVSSIEDHGRIRFGAGYRLKTSK